MAALVHSLPSDFQKTPKSQYEDDNKEGSGLGLRWHPYIAKIYPHKQHATDAGGSKGELGQPPLKRGTPPCAQKVYSRSDLFYKTIVGCLGQYPVLRGREAGGCLWGTFGRL